MMLKNLFLFRSDKVWQITVLLIPFVMLSLAASCDRSGTAGSQGGDDQDNLDSLALLENASERITRLSEAIVENPDVASLYLERGLEFRESNNAMALSDIKKAWLLDSGNSVINRALADQYMEMGDSRAALGVLNRHIGNKPEDLDALWDLANMATVIKQYQASNGAVSQILRLDVQNAEAYYLRGRNFRLMGDTADAISAYQTAIEVNPDFIQPYLELGVILSAQEDSRALRYLDNVLQMDSLNDIARYQIAKFHQDAGNLNEAVEAYEEIVRLSPQNDDALYNLGTIFYGVDSLQTAMRYFDLTTKVSPARAMAHYGKALCAIGLGQNKDAALYAQQAYNLDSELDFAIELADSLRATLN